MGAKVSIIIPVHNTENHMKKCLDSVINQTFTNLEILCVDDSSTDNSLEILNAYAEKDERFVIISLTGEPVGAAETRNQAFKVMTGDYVYFVDSDDWIDNDYVEKMVDAIENSGAQVVMNRNIIEEYPNGPKKYVHPKDKLHPDGSFIPGKIAIGDTFCSIWSKMYKKELFDKYNLMLPKGLPNDDFCFQYTSLVHVKDVYVFSGPSYHYLYREGSVTKTQVNKDIDHLRAYSRVYDYYKENGLLDSGVKIFNILPFYSVENEEKYLEYKRYFQKTIDYLRSDSVLYNDIDMFFANNILNTKDFKEYSAKFPKSVLMSYLNRNKVKTRG